MLLRSVVRSFTLVVMVTLLILTAPAQEAPSDAVPPVAASPSDQAPAEDDLFLATLPQDIAGSDYYALLAWVRSLGLSTAGSATELRARLYDHYSLRAPPPLAPSTRIITIQSADRTEYISAQGEGNSFIRLSGRVSVLLVDSEAGERLSIEANELLVNRDASILSARGDISFERIRPDGKDYFYGQVMELDMDDWSGVFLDGKSVRGDEKTTMMVFKAKDIVRRSGTVLVFDDGEITSCDDEFAHFSIRASTIWILGANEWAMANATLSVGEVPLLYLPFF